MDKPELVNILTKITYRLPWEGWGLTDEEFITIDLASSEEIADVIYNKGLKVATLIDNSDILVDLYNQQLQSKLKAKKMVRELKNLKLDLYSDLPRIKKVKPPDSEEVERRLMEETINEIVGDSGPLQDNEETESTDFNIDKRCKELGLIPDRGFKPLVESIAFGSPSLERNQDSNILPPSSITIHDLPDRNFEMFMSNEGFGEANLQEIAEAGIFDTVNGRQIYDLINNRKSFEEIGEIARRRRATQLSLNTPDIIITDEEELHVIPDKAQQQVSLPANQSILFSDFDNIDMLEPLQAHAPALDQIAEPARFSRRDMFDKIAIEAAHAEKPKRRRKRRRIRQSSPLRIEAEEFLDLNEPLKRHKRQKKKSGPYKPKPTLHVLLDIFEDLSDYGPDRNWVEAEEEEQIEMDYQSRQAPSEQSALGSVQEMRNKRQSVQMPIETPDQVHDAKRQRLDDDVRRIIGFDENSSSFAVPEIAPPVIAATPRVSSIASFHPDITSTVQRPRPSGARLAMDDLLFAEYQEISKENLNPNQRSDIEALVNKLDRHKRIGPTPMKEAVAAPLPESPTRVKRYEKDGEKMIALRNDDGSHEFYTEYNLETMFLYMQVRLMMKTAGRWKMKLSELKPQLKLLKPAKELIIEMRIRLLGDCGFFNLTFTEDDHIDEVEIKINPAANAQAQ